MSKFVFHGSLNHKGLDYLQPVSMGGSNGSMDGIGVNLTSSANLASFYAQSGNGAKQGSVYIVELDADEFVVISDDNYLTQEQADCVLDEISYLSKPEQFRLFTDIAGREEHEFAEISQVEPIYDREYERASSYGLDRLKPQIDDNENGFVVKTVRECLSAEQIMAVSHSQLHYLLNLYDNGFATDCYKRFSKGLILPRESGETNYLSFRPFEDISEEVDLSTLPENADTLGYLNERRLKLERGEQDFDFELDRYITLFVDNKGALYESSFDITYPLSLKTELTIERFPRPHIWVERDSGQSDSLNRALSNLVRSKPELSEYELRFDNYRVSLGDYLNEALNSTKPKKGYHGTCTAVIEGIGLDGLLPRNDSGAEAHYIGSAKESLTDRVYFASKEGMGAAISAARSAAKANGGSPVILEFDIKSLDADLLAPDEDSKRDCPFESLEACGTAAYKGKIDADSISICVEEFVPEDLRRDFEVSLANSLFEIAKSQTLEEKCETSIALSNHVARKF